MSCRFLFIAVFFLILSCTGESQENIEKQSSPFFSSIEYLYKVPAEQPDGWAISSDLHEQRAEELVSRLMSDTVLGLSGVLLSRKGSLILEEYKEEFKPTLTEDTLLSLQENELLLVSILAGIYQKLDSGGLNNKMVSLPAINHAVRKPGPVSSVGLDQLLKMETDVLCRPQQILKEIAGQIPAKGFYYCPANYEAVADWLELQTEEPLSFYAEENLFEPLEIDRYQWDDLDKKMPPRDLLKLASLHAQNGQWHQNQILPENWVLQLKSRAYDKKALGTFAWGWWQQLLLVNGRQYAFYYSKGKNYFLAFIPDLDASLLLVGNLQKPAAEYFPLLKEQAIPALEKR